MTRAPVINEVGIPNIKDYNISSPAFGKHVKPAYDDMFSVLLGFMI